MIRTADIWPDAEAEDAEKMECSSETRKYVGVTVAFDESGRMFPRSILWEDGQVYAIDRVLDMRPSFSQKSGGQGDMYTVMIGSHQGHLFFERSTESFTGSPGRWFVESA